MNDDPTGFSSLREAPPPPIDHVRRRVSRRRSRRRGLGLAAVAAGLGLVFFALPREQVRDRGTGALPLVALDAVAEGPRGLRPLPDGAVVAPDERVVFFVRTSVDGTATLREQGGSAAVSVLPSWSVGAGESTAGGGAPLAWRPDRALGSARYVLEVCAPPAPCGSDVLTLRWAP